LAFTCEDTVDVSVVSEG